MNLRLPPQHSHLWSLADQVMVSGSNFLCSILLARTLGLEVFGAYVVAQTYLLYANIFQSALVVAPMMTAVPAETLAPVRKTLLHGFMGYAFLVLACTLVVVQLAAGGLGVWSPAIGLGELALPLAGAMVGFQLQDWSRRACYSETKNRIVFWADSVAYLGQLACLLALAATQKLSAVTAIWVMAITFSVSFAAVMVVTKLWPDSQSTTAVIRHHWRASKNFLVSWQLQWLGASGVILLGTGVIGTQAAGAIRAVSNLLGPINVAFQWMDNVVPVRAAARMRSMGRGALRAYLWRIVILGMVALGSFTMLLALVDETLIVLLYGEAYRPFAVLVVFQAVYNLFSHAYRMVSYFQRAINATKPLAIASAWWAAVAVLMALLLVRPFEDRGIMTALILGELAGLIYLLTRHIKRQPDSTHLVVRRGDGSVHLLLPIASVPLSRAALQMYYPSRWSGRLYRAAIKWTLGLRLALRLAEMHPPLKSTYPHIDDVLCSDQGNLLEATGVLVSAPGPSSKLTIKLMDKSARVTAYARLAYGADAIATVQREAKVLQALAGSSVKAQIPSVLKHCAFTAPTAYCLVESAGPELASGPTLTALHFDFLRRLVTPAELNWVTVVNALRSDVEELLASTRLQTTCLRACDLLQNSTINHFPVCVEHGDFAPWNIRSDTKGALFFIDWEHARVDGLPWMDAMHFCYQQAVLVKRASPVVVLSMLRDVFMLPAATTYRSVLGVTPSHTDCFIMVYLVRKLLVGSKENKSADIKDASICVNVLKVLVDSPTLQPSQVVL